MPSAHTTLRELVTHLGRAQRAFDAGRLDEAERALDEALTLDPRNVQAADLRLRIEREHERANARGEGAGARVARTTVPPGVSLDAPPSARRVVERVRPEPLRSRADAPSGRVSPAAWSTFEQRIRERRADRAVTDAQAAMARGDREATLVAFAELEAVSPGDARRAGIETWLNHTVGHSAARESESAWVPAFDDTPVEGAAAGVPVYMMAAREATLERDVPADSASAAGWRNDTRRPGRRRRRARLVVGAALAASVLVSLWMYDGARQEPDAVLAEDTAAVPSSTPPASTMGAPQDEFGELPPVPFNEPDAAARDGSEGPLSLEGVETQPADTRQIATLSAQPPPGPAPRASPEPDERAPVPADQASQPGGTPVTGSREIARAEPSPPLEGPVQFMIAPPQALRSPGGERQVNQAITPVPVSPMNAPIPPAATAVTPPPGALSPEVANADAVREVVNGYADAFSALDASATQRVWPGADVRGLRRAFDQLSAQTITFNRCEVNASDDVAEAVCTGRQQWVPKVGDRTPKSEARTWRFALGRDGGEWVIDGVEVQR
jgi:hypothetical protein